MNNSNLSTGPQGAQGASDTFVFDTTTGLCGPSGPIFSTGNSSYSTAYISASIPSWNNTTINNSSSTPLITIPYGTDTVVLEEAAALDVKGRIKMNGEFLDERLERIEKILTIPTRNIDMEEKYPKLKEIWELYNYTLEKYTTWENIKK